MPFRGIQARVEAILARRVVRFALVGGIGVPINVAFLWLFHSKFHIDTLIAWLMAFECSALVNFYANQRFTYHEQTHVQGVEWLWRAFRAQLSSLSGVVVNALIFGLLLAAGLHYLEADTGGIIAAFSCNYFIANKFVFTPAAASMGVIASDMIGRATVSGHSSGAAEVIAGQEGEHIRHGLVSLAAVEEIA